MFKKIIFLGVFFTFISATNARNVLRNNCSLSRIATIISTDESLLERMVVDKEFNKYYVSTLEFINMLVESKAGDLFQKYIKQTLTKDEEAILITKLKLSNVEELDKIGIKLKNERIAYSNKFPELKTLAEKERTKLMSDIVKKINSDKAFTIKNAKLFRITYYNCWSAYIACVAGCFIACDGRTSACI